MSGEEAVTELEASLKAIRSLEGKTLAGDLARNQAIARNVMREEIGDYGSYEGTKYQLDEQTRDILLAHARQDAAHAATNSTDIIRKLDKLARAQRTIVILVLASLSIAIITAATVVF